MKLLKFFYMKKLIFQRFDSIKNKIKELQSKKLLLHILRRKKKEKEFINFLITMIIILIVLKKKLIIVKTKRIYMKYNTFI